MVKWFEARRLKKLEKLEIKCIKDLANLNCEVEQYQKQITKYRQFARDAVSTGKRELAHQYANIIIRYRKQKDELIKTKNSTEAACYYISFKISGVEQVPLPSGQSPAELSDLVNLFSGKLPLEEIAARIEDKQLFLEDKISLTALGFRELKRYAERTHEYGDIIGAAAENNGGS